MTLSADHRVQDTVTLSAGSGHCDTVTLSPGTGHCEFSKHSSHTRLSTAVTTYVDAERWFAAVAKLWEPTVLSTSLFESICFLPEIN